MPAFVGRDVDGVGASLHRRRGPSTAALGGTAMLAMLKPHLGRAVPGRGRRRAPAPAAGTRALPRAGAGRRRQPAGRRPQNADPPAGGQGAKQMAGAEDLVVVVRQDEEGRARLAIRLGGNPASRDGSQGDRAVGVCETLEGRGPGASQAYSRAAARMRACSLAVVQQLAPRPRRSRAHRRARPKSRDVADHRVLGPRAGADHRRQARGRRLEHCLAERLGVAGKQKDVGRGEDRRELGAGLDAEEGGIGGELAQPLARGPSPTMTSCTSSRRARSAA